MLTSELVISSDEYEKIAKLVYDRFGINLGNKKQSLVTNRLRKVLVENGFNSFDQFYNYVLHDKTGQGLDILINRISTNLTYFARENEHFIFLKDNLLPETLKKSVSKDKTLRVWCAGCSTGEEAYTLAMILKDATKNNSENIMLGLLATDISARALEIAIKGEYKTEEVAKLNPLFNNSYFNPVSGTMSVVKPDIKDIVMFRRLNLMRNEFPFKNKFHVIFCRNVMIYFDEETRTKLIKKFHYYLAKGGHLFIGHSESLGRSNKYFEYIKPAVYRKIG